MYPFWNPVILPLLRSAQARSIVEVGMYKGETTKEVLAYCKEIDGTLIGIDIESHPEILRLKEQYPDQFHLYEDASLNVLATITACDAVLIDGDHNWYTVFHELKLLEKIAKQQGKFPLVFLHDTEWPYARRDRYDNPGMIPEQYRQPNRRGGIVLENDMLQTQEGLSFETFHALYAHGLQNGVLSAVEDFLDQTTLSLRREHMHGFHGLDILIDTATLGSHPGLQTMLHSLQSGESIRSIMDQIENERMKHRLHIHALQRDHIRIEHTLTEERHARRLEAKRYATEQDSLQHVLQTKQEELRRMESDMHAISAERDLLQQELQKQREALNRLKAEMLSVSQERDAFAQQQRILLTKIEDARMQKTVVDQLLREKKEEMQRNAESLQKALLSKKAADDSLQHVLRSRSWRLTAPLRLGEAACRTALSARWMYGVFAAGKEIWIDIGEPFPGIVRFVRHRLLGKRWPASLSTVVTPADASPSHATESPPIAAPSPLLPPSSDVAVVIPCHNYGRYLEEAIESVLHQSLQPTEIIVVDDSSDDDTAQVAQRFASHGVRYLRGEWKSVGEARNAGMQQTKAPYLVFLDADNMLHREYVRLGLEALHAETNAAIAYCDLQKFGNNDTLRTFPKEFDWERFECHNHMDACAVVRRDALMQAGGFSHGRKQDGDWVTWRRILRLGWKAIKSNGICFYRIHDRNMALSLRETSYVQRAAFLEEQATLCIILTGQEELWPRIEAFLRAQTFPHASLHLVLIDCSTSVALQRMVRSYLGTCDYGAHTYMRENTPLAKNIPTDHLQSAAYARSINRLSTMVSGGLLFIVGEDIEPPIDAFERLIRQFTADVVSVSAAVAPLPHRRAGVWNWSEDGRIAIVENGTGACKVGGADFDCTVIRSTFVQHNVLHAGAPFGSPARNFYAAFRDRPHRHVIVDWDVHCRVISPHNGSTPLPS